MQYLKPILIITIASVASFLVYVSLTREEWSTRKKCIACEALKNQEQRRVVGTVEILSNGQTIFTEQLTNLTYILKACDATCASKELLSFSKLGVKDYDTKKSIYFDIEGKFIPEKNEFIYSFIIVLNERNFVNVGAIKNWTFDKIQEKNTALEQEIFLLNESHYAGLRAFLPHYFTETQLKQPIAIREATWETSDNTLITIRFIEKQKQWHPIEQYEWQKGAEF